VKTTTTYEGIDSFINIFMTLNVDDEDEEEFREVETEAEVFRDDLIPNAILI